MSQIFRDIFLRNKSSEIDLKEWMGIIRSYGELKHTLKFGHYSIDPYDKSRDFNYFKPQRLKVSITHAEPRDSNTWNSNLVIDEITSLLVLASGRIMTSNHEYLLLLNNEEKIVEIANNTFNHHQNLTVSIEESETQENLNKIWFHINRITTQESYQKFCTLIKAINLYKGSLELAAHNYEAAYTLLVSSAECVAGIFSSIKPTHKDIPQFTEIEKLFEKHEINESFKSDLLEILYKPNHIKLQAKFKEVIISNLSNNFFDNPPLLYTPIGKDYNPENHTFTFVGWRTTPDDNWNFDKSELNKLLTNVYNKRSSFVHAGEEWSKFNKLFSTGIIPQSIKTNKAGKPMKDKTGEYILNEKELSYFGFERIMNNVLLNLFNKI